MCDALENSSIVKTFLPVINSATEYERISEILPNRMNNDFLIV